MVCPDLKVEITLRTRQRTVLPALMKDGVETIELEKT
jgi:hypothetical protein